MSRDRQRVNMDNLTNLKIKERKNDEQYFEKVIRKSGRSTFDFLQIVTSALKKRATRFLSTGEK